LLYTPLFKSLEENSYLSSSSVEQASKLLSTFAKNSKVLTDVDGEGQEPHYSSGKVTFLGLQLERGGLGARQARDEESIPIEAQYHTPRITESPAGWLLSILRVPFCEDTPHLYLGARIRDALRQVH
jgi:hypothetical protein